MDTLILMKISKLESRFNDVERVGDNRTDNTGSWGMEKVVACMLLLLLKVFEGTKEWVAAEAGFKNSCSHAFVKAFVAIFLKDEERSLMNVTDEVIIELKSFGRDHEGHFNVFKGLKNGSRDDTADHAENSILTYHCKFSF